MRMVRRFRLLAIVAGLVAVSAAACDAVHGSRVSSGFSSQPRTVTAVPVQPADTTVPSGPRVPPVSAAARAAGFVDVRSVVPDAIIDLRYATPRNVTGARLYPADARCLVHQSMAQGLAAAAAVLRPRGQVFVFWDCYRPHDIQVKLFDVVSNPAWVAPPGRYAHSHEVGRSVDVTFASAQQQCPAERQEGGLCLGDMGTDFDDFSSGAKAFATQDVTAEAQANRAHLRAAMSAGGLSVYAGEWWHFDGPGAGVDHPILNVSVD
ncbi:M15 family metallopeptidase [Mycobacterium haemophilum]|uniref:D-alanyl-D-alanine dipeptidase n=1 Tax=Mycobacterium haemophilum TaxID=29311 RepID=A0A0I9VJA6_9MYCO|nr:M15 family metallopeptidase [Mycobacterium haemophilum]KLO29954.1 D-alanyl-D-alanine dipeptidase [Mycobacterium haemophilum]KLO38699.1 D-alanyl-D-alanine dipeptidase [Mycobacterium haemophilum]KLO45016.1 D-alanyl-D-alanine dipeptidase [Mycobacterium haemophilum]KLO56360.1 D-alanyl-D-alanine dipeptidase [Mycobacterium haemophilum]